MKYLMLICCIVGALHAVCFAGDTPSIAGGKSKLPPGSKLCDKPKPPSTSEAVSKDDDASIVWKKSYMGFIIKGKNPEYHVILRLGLEQWEDSKLTPLREQWFLSCDYPSYIEKIKADCSLDRMTITYLSGMVGGAIIRTYEHSSDNGTLQLSNVDWRRGILDFDIIYPDKSKTSVAMNMKYVDTSIYLNSFKAVSTKRLILEDRPIITIEYKIPEYTYMLEVKIEMRGMKSEDQKARDEFISSLSGQDKLVFEKESKDGTLFTKPQEKEFKQKFEEKFSRTELENIGEKSFEDWTPDQRERYKSIFKTIMIDTLEKSLTQSRLSINGKEKLRNYITNYITKEFEK